MALRRVARDHADHARAGAGDDRGVHPRLGARVLAIERRDTPNPKPRGPAARSSAARVVQNPSWGCAGSCPRQAPARMERGSNSARRDATVGIAGRLLTQLT